jgi:predicted Zn-dependent protease
MGLIFAAMAGYDTNVAVTFWQRMAAQSQGQQVTWLSSHPSDAQRVSDIQKHLPEALMYYKKATTPVTTTYTTGTKSSAKKTTTKKSTTKKKTTKKK